MSLFHTIISTHCKDSMPRNYLWELRLSVNEYEELKEAIRKSAIYREFTTVDREVALFFSEWWRREFRGGHASYEDICYDLLGSTELTEKLCSAAKSGARRIGIRIIKTSGDQRDVDNFKYSIFYQGGLPMNYIANEIISHGFSAWDRFFRALVWNEQDYSQIPGKIAPLSDSIKEFCLALQLAADNKNPLQLPFSYNKNWWDIIIKDFEDEKRKRKARNPFEFKWNLLFDDIHKAIKLSYSISGPQHLPAEFIEQHNLKGKSFCSISLLVNGTHAFTAEYNEKYYCRRTVDREFQYNPGDEISIVINESGEILATRDLDFSDPKLVTKSDEGFTNRFSLCDARKLSSQDCRIIATKDWEHSDIPPVDYSLGEEHLSVFFLSQGDSIVSLTSEMSFEQKSFDPDVPIAWTAISEASALMSNIPTKERIYNAPDGVEFYKGIGDKVSKMAQPVVFADKGSRNWTSKPKLGEIRAKLKLSGNESVDAVKFINTGIFSTEIISSSRDVCKFVITWKYGSVSSDEATCSDGVWTVDRTKLSDSRYVTFTFKPEIGNGEPFVLHLCPPFYGFRIYDFYGKEVKNNSIIPIVELDNFRYYLHLPDRMDLWPNKENKDLKYRYLFQGDGQNSLFELLCDSEQRRGTVACEGRLASLFLDGSEQITGVLERSCESLPDAVATMEIRQSNNISQYLFKDFPYCLQHDGSNIWISNDDDKLPSYSGQLMAIPFEQPNIEPICISADDETPESFKIPSEILESPYRKWLIFGTIRGYIQPKLLCLDEIPDSDERILMRDEILAKIKANLENDNAFSITWSNAFEWYKKLPLGQIPGTSILELVAIADDWSLLQKFAFQLYLMNSGSEDKLNDLADSLLDFQQQMSFLWQWAANQSLSNFASSIAKNEPLLLRPYYNGWVIKHTESEKWAEYMMTDAHIEECISDLLVDFDEWMQTLKSQSIPERRLINPDINSNGDGLRSDEARDAFQWVNSVVKNQAQGNLSLNDIWILERRTFSDMFASIDFGTIGENEKIKREIRKSIIYGMQFKLSDEI